MAIKEVWFNCSGIASVFTPKVGITQEWRMSSAVMITWIGDSMGINCSGQPPVIGRALWDHCVKNKVGSTVGNAKKAQ